MATLSREQRKLLESTVVAARGVAERGAAKALTALGVGDRRPPELSDAEKILRRQLRAHGHQLGDAVKNDEQETTHLKQACAYEHWHRMLFARFLAENDLLLNPEYGVAMSLAEIQETARAQNRDWLSLASDYAQRMLLEVFRPDDPVLQVVMPPETRQELEAALAQLPAEIFTAADDSLGWVYQFWQRDEKERVNKLEVKIGADELSPVTQIFTEDYMVLCLLHNTLGSWWAAKRRAEGKTHELPGYEWTYLRLNDDGSPAAGNFDGWPKTARELRVLDPCMGSGHFLTFALPILARMRMEEEGLSISEAVQSTVAENLFGLELDARCSQIAAFNLALTAWRMLGRPMELPAMNLACSGLGINAQETEWILLAREDGRAREEMKRLYSLFRDAPTLGSLIDPRRLEANVYSSGGEFALPLLEEALSKEQPNDETRELAVAAQGVAAAFRILAGEFTLVVTNVPYLGRRKQSSVLADYCEEFHADAKADLATCFMDRCLGFCRHGGSIALVTPQNWSFLGTYRHFRERLFRDTSWSMAVKLGGNAFQDMNWWAATTALFALSRCPPQAEQIFIGFDVGHLKEQADKADALRSLPSMAIIQRSQLLNPDSRLVLGSSSDHPLLADFAAYGKGSTTGDSPHYHRFFWEFPSVPATAVPWLDSPRPGSSWSGRSTLLWNGLNDPAMTAEKGSRIHGQSVWGKLGVAVNKSNKLEPFLSLGEVFDDNIGTIVPFDQELILPILAFCESPAYHASLRLIDQKVNVTAATLVKVPFDVMHCQQMANEKYTSGVLRPQSNDPTQWLFGGHPNGSEHPVQVAIARLIGYRWPRQTGSDFPHCPPIGPDEVDPHADVDGIVCLTSLGGEPPAADRIRALLAEAYGTEWSAARLAELLGGGDSLETWLRDVFFERHCEIFHGRPFIWHIWDGRKDGFHALVNYHKLARRDGEGRKTLEKLIYTSLGDWISRQQAEVESGVDGAEGRLAAAKHLKAELTNIVNGEPPYDLFIRWKPLHEQPVGWEPDLNDGIRLNMRPWLHAKPYQEPNQKLKQGACILRVTPIKLPLGKDRGKEPLHDKTDFPWYATSQDRTNDEHFTLEQKRTARERKKKA